MMMKHGLTVNKLPLCTFIPNGILQYNEQHTYYCINNMSNDYIKHWNIEFCYAALHQLFVIVLGRHSSKNIQRITLNVCYITITLMQFSNLMTMIHVCCVRMTYFVATDNCVGFIKAKTPH